MASKSRDDADGLHRHQHQRRRRRHPPRRPDASRTTRPAWTRSRSTSPGIVETSGPRTPLPELWDPAVLDGTTQAGFAGNPLMQVDGANAGRGATGLKLWGGSTRRAWRSRTSPSTASRCSTAGSSPGTTVAGMWIGLANLAGRPRQYGPKPADLEVGEQLGRRDQRGGPKRHLRLARTEGTLGVLIRVRPRRTTGEATTSAPTRPARRPGRTRGRAWHPGCAGNNQVGGTHLGQRQGRHPDLQVGRDRQRRAGQPVGTDATAPRRSPTGCHGSEIQSANNAVGRRATGGMLNVISATPRPVSCCGTAGATWNTIRGNYIGGTSAAAAAKVGTAARGRAQRGERKAIPGT